jgi:hypothetical protein
MSIEYLVYTPDARPITVEEVSAALAAGGWTMRVSRGDYRWFAGQPVTAGALEDDDLILGWRSSAPHAADVARAVDARDEEASKPFWEQDVLGLCVLYVQLPYDPADDLAEEETREELLDVYGQEYLDARGRARASYVTRTSSGRNEPSFQLQLTVAQCIVRMRGGLFEDETGGEYEIVTPE